VTKKIVISGGGILGISIGIAILKNNKQIEVELHEKEPRVAEHASGRNSGVLHAGFYYSPESLKAKFCREGNTQLQFYINKYDVPYARPGKVVLAQSESELASLVKLYDRGIKNGVDLEMRPARDLARIEPLAASDHDFLWSPTTGVSDPIKVTEALAREFVSLGGSIKLGSEITFRSGLRANGESISADHFINAAGAYSIDLAHAMGVGSEYRVMPFLGTYKQVDQKTLPIRTLIYPVPHPVNPFLGVHFTLTIDNKVKIGPTAIPILGKEQYRLTNGFTLRDIKDFLRNTTSIVRGEKHNLGSIAISEFPNLIEKTLLQRAAKLVPSASSVNRWGKKRPGIRSQLLNVSKGELVQDFVVEGDGRSTHVLNAVSPGWTAAMPFGEYVAKIALKLS